MTISISSEVKCAAPEGDYAGIPPWGNGTFPVLFPLLEGERRGDAEKSHRQTKRVRGKMMDVTFPAELGNLAAHLQQK